MAELLGQRSCRAQTQGVSKSVAVVEGLDWLVRGKSATTLAILTQFECKKGFNAFKISGPNTSATSLP